VELHNHHRHARNECGALDALPFPFAVAIAHGEFVPSSDYAYKAGLVVDHSGPFWWWEAVKDYRLLFESVGPYRGATQNVG